MYIAQYISICNDIWSLYQFFYKKNLNRDFALSYFNLSTITYEVIFQVTENCASSNQTKPIYTKPVGYVNQQCVIHVHMSWGTFIT